MHEHTQSPSLRQHMPRSRPRCGLTPSKFGEDAEAWGLVGLLHDFDYEKFPNAEHSATDGHPAWASICCAPKASAEHSCGRCWDTPTYSGVPRDTSMAKTLFAVDELCGFLVACALVRPSKSFADLEVSSVKKKLKDKAFRPRREPR